MLKTHLLVVDPQHDFCHPSGALYVKGAEKDMERLSSLIANNGERISRITVTMDMHKNYHIASPLFWVDDAGRNPEPYTIISTKDVEEGMWNAANPNHRAWTLKYVRTLEKNGRYQLCIWPYHCIIGTEGCNVYSSLLKALSVFERRYYKHVDYIFKGSCSLTEHYSALFADVPIPADGSTLINRNLLISMAEADAVLIAGEALSHCVANTIMDIGNGLNHDLSKFILLEDASSNVAGFEALGEEFIHKARLMGMRVSNTFKIMDEI